ncbi:hypothetical protein [Persephonella sp.]
MAQFRLIRFHPTKLEISITAQQLLSMFPIEIQEHPVMGEIERVWISQNTVYSVKNSPEDHILDLSGNRKHLKLKEDKMLEIIQNLEKFEIALYYEGNVDKYIVEKLK